MVVHHGTSASSAASFQLGGLTTSFIISTLMQTNFGCLKSLASRDTQKMHVNGQMREEKAQGACIQDAFPSRRFPSRVT